MRNKLLLSSALALALSIPAVAAAQQAPTTQPAPEAEATVAAPEQGQATGGANVTVIPPQEDAEAATGAEQAVEGEALETETEGETLATEEIEVEAEPADAAATTPETTTEATAETTTETTTGSSMSAGSGVEVSADDMMGRPVMGTDGQQLGEVSDVIVDPETMEMRRLVIDSGGFLGFGAKRIALDRDQVEIRPEEGIMARELTREDVEALPEFDPEGETASLDQPEPTTPAPAGGMAPAPAPAPAAQ
ncbi:PRC-barrel domain-containing protein [Arenibaculum sp.]|jgi:sporulation protein YlmC with PRC-barrel domain|uniref:PRC-barrel domain-containing protein n=1 Tax=Arenibaculum sp. TaxID=2865862 RepID=UPI002E135D09|nr:PRC-barrel domain-containing protein [Arenibaculum sp.]